MVRKILQTSFMIGVATFWFGLIAAAIFAILGTFASGMLGDEHPPAYWNYGLYFTTALMVVYFFTSDKPGQNAGPTILRSIWAGNGMFPKKLIDRSNG